MIASGGGAAGVNLPLDWMEIALTRIISHYFINVTTENTLAQLRGK